MVDQIIEDVNKALDAEAYFAALSLVLMLPDICAKAEFPNTQRNNRERYIKWYDEHIGDYEHLDWTEEYPEEDHNPYLSGEVIYSLRCNMLHQGTPNINKDDIKNDENNKIDKFVILVEKKKEMEIYGDTSITSTRGSEVVNREYRMSLRRLCWIINQVCGNYYKNHKEQFNFFNYEIVKE